MQKKPLLALIVIFIFLSSNVFAFNIFSFFRWIDFFYSKYFDDEQPSTIYPKNTTKKEVTSGDEFLDINESVSNNTVVSTKDYDSTTTTSVSTSSFIIKSETTTSSSSISTEHTEQEGEQEEEAIVEQVNLTKLCGNNRLDEGETIVDCGGVCFETCDLFDLNMSGTHNYLGFRFEFEKVMLSDRGGNYLVEITSPENISIEGYLRDDDYGYIENVKYTVVGSRDRQIRFMVENDNEVLKADQGKVFMVGGRDCTKTDFCYRDYKGYNISVLNRDEQRYRVILPDGASSQVTLSNRSFATPDNNLAMRTVKPWVLGGYSYIQVWLIPDSGGFNLSQVVLL